MTEICEQCGEDIDWGWPYACELCEKTVCDECQMNGMTEDGENVLICWSCHMGQAE